MENYNAYEKNPVTQAVLWLLPSAIEISVYAVIAFITLALSNVDFIHEFFLLSDDFSLRTAVLGSAETFLAGAVGEKAAATLVTGLFWGLVGMLVYVIIWLFGNFSTELSNDLAIAHFVHPAEADTYSPLRHLLLKVIFQLFVGVMLLIGINLLFTVLLPTWTAAYSTLIDDWPELSAVKDALLAVGWQVLSLHVLTVLLRLLLLRKRIFNI